MHPVYELLERVFSDNKKPSGIFNEIRTYIETGDENALRLIKTNGPSWQYYEDWYKYESRFEKSFVLKEEMDEIETRLLDIFLENENWPYRIERFLKNEQDDENLFAPLFESLKRRGHTDSGIIASFFGKCVLKNASGNPNSGVRYYLSLTDKELIERIALFVNEDAALKNLTSVILEHAPERIDNLLEWLILQMPQRYSEKVKIRAHQFAPLTACTILRKTGDRYLERVFDLWNTIPALYHKYASGLYLNETGFDVFLEPLKETAKIVYETVLRRHEVGISCFLIEHFGHEYVGEILNRAKIFQPYCENFIHKEILETAWKKLGTNSRSIFETAFKYPHADHRMTVMSFLTSLGEPEFEDFIESQFRIELYGEPESSALFLKLLKPWKPERFTDDLWTLLSHKSKRVRDAAAGVVAGMNALDMDRLEKLLDSKKADSRDSAVTILGKLGTETTINLLENRLEKESNEDIRDKIFLLLEKSREERGITITLSDIRKQYERAKSKVDKFSPKWLDFEKLPPLFTGKNELLEPELVRYLLYRQSRCKEIRADIEAKPLYRMIDWNTCGEFGLFVLKSFLQSGEIDASDRWALTVGALFGDERIVPILVKQVQVWADSSRGKMSEYAVQALALQGNGAALMAVNTMIIRYRAKYKFIGATAAAAFETVAESRGITVDQLADDVVPWLGFEPGKAKKYSFDGKDFEFRIGTDFKLLIFDLQKNRKIASLPKSAPEEIVADFKEIRDSLKEIVKGQLLRMENLLVSQYRWESESWKSLYLHHPILRPFTVRLLWGIYDRNLLEKTFRGLEDGTLSDIEDNPIQIPNGVKIGIVHPLELNIDAKNDWISHFIDYEIAPPFPQLERSVVFPKESELELKTIESWKGTEINALTFKGRIDRLGWRRGPVEDAGYVSGYCKQFPESGVDAFLGTENFYISGSARDDTINLGSLCFVRGDSVKFGSYVYDAPDTVSGNDERIMKVKDVPPIVYSEVIANLHSIAGTPEI